VRRQCAPQHLLDPSALGKVVTQAVLEDLESVFAHRLGPVHRGVGVLQDRVGGDRATVMRLGQRRGDADAHGDNMADVADRDGLTQCIEDPVGDLQGERMGRPGVDVAIRVVGVTARVVGTVPGFDEDDELVASDSGDGVALTQDALKSARGLEQHGVPRRMARGVVDPFEPVEIAEENRDLPPVATRAAQGRAEAIHQKSPVGQAGEGVMQGRVGELLLGLHDVGHVTARADDLHDPAGLVPTEWRDPAAEPAPSAVDMPGAESGEQHLTVLESDRIEVGQTDRVPVLGVEQVDDFVRLERESPAPGDAEGVFVLGRVGRHAGRQVEDERLVRSRSVNGLQEGAGLRGLHLGGDELGNVGDGADDAGDLPLLMLNVAPPFEVALHPVVRAGYAVPHAEWLPGPQAGTQRSLDPLLVIGVNARHP
jgi:hypothetical protein